MPKWALEAEASNKVAEPGGADTAAKEAMGAWSGVIEMPRGALPTAIGAAAMPVARSTGVTVSALELAT